MRRLVARPLVSTQVGRQLLEQAFTLVELLITLALIGILTTLAVPELLRVLREIKVDRAILELRQLDFEIKRYEDSNGAWPDSLADLQGGSKNDPWGNAYAYQAHRGPGWRGSARKDRFLVPLNSDYDLFSMGEDGDSRPPLAVPVSHDDIVRAADGLFFGRARDF